MKGSAWTGAERDWRRAPHHYAAIHFHDDDLHDCGWLDDFTFDRPEGNGERLLRLAPHCGSARDWLPFFVRPQIGKPQACRLPRLDLHLPGLFQPPARQ